MDILTYFTRSVSILLAFTLMYMLTCRKDSHFSLYRYFLLLGLILSLLMPLIEIRYTVFIEPLKTNEVFKEVEAPMVAAASVADNSTASLDWFALVYWIYLTGLVVFMSRIVVSIIQVMRLMRSCSRKVVDGITFFVGKEITEPFTFGSYIFLDDVISQNQLNTDIIAHEKVHLEQNHWLDVMLSELLIAIQWFNPLAWYYGRLVKENLEFLADRGVVNQGYSIERYIQSIICVTMGAEASVLANHFRFSQNKRRLKMMKNVRKSKWRQLKLLLVLPLISGFLWAFSQPVYQVQAIEESAEIHNNVNNRGKKVVVTGYVVLSDTADIRNPKTGLFERKIIVGSLPDVSIVLKGKNRGTLSDSRGGFKLEADINDTLVFSYIGFKTEERKVVDDKDIIVYFKPSSYELDPSPFREKYKGKVIPPPPPPQIEVKENEKRIVPPPVEDNESDYVIVEELPQYFGGMENYFARMYTLIEQAKKKQKLSGIVKVQFKVNEKGEIINVSAMRPKSPASEVAEEIVTGLNQWKPARQRGRPVNCTLVVPVEFE